METNKGINTTWLDHETGRQFEIQYHTPESLAATERTHGIYEYSRLDSTSAEDRKVCDYLQYQENKDVAAPEGHERLATPRTQDVPETPDQTDVDRVRAAIQEHHEQQHHSVGHAEPEPAEPEPRAPGRGPPGQETQQPVPEESARGASDDYVDRQQARAQQEAAQNNEAQASAAAPETDVGGQQDHGIG